MSDNRKPESPTNLQHITTRQMNQNLTAFGRHVKVVGVGDLGIEALEGDAKVAARRLGVVHNLADGGAWVKRQRTVKSGARRMINRPIKTITG